MRFKITLDRPKSAEKPVSLHPLSFKEAVASLLSVPPPADPAELSGPADARADSGG